MQPVLFCVQTLTFSILINGTSHGFFSPHRGLRQGDPFSPYLFILCAEVLSWNIQHLQHQHIFHGIKISPKNPEITHVMFVDDLIVFGRANFGEAHVLQKLIQTYCRAL